MSSTQKGKNVSKNKYRKQLDRRRKIVADFYSFDVATVETFSISQLDWYYARASYQLPLNRIWRSVKRFGHALWYATYLDIAFPWWR